MGVGVGRECIRSRRISDLTSLSVWYYTLLEKKRCEGVLTWTMWLVSILEHPR